MFDVSSSPVVLTQGSKLRLWFGEDLADLSEDDNQGTICADLFANFEEKRTGNGTYRIS